MAKHEVRVILPRMELKLIDRALDTGKNDNGRSWMLEFPDAPSMACEVMLLGSGEDCRLQAGLYDRAHDVTVNSDVGYSTGGDWEFDYEGDAYLIGFAALEDQQRNTMTLRTP